MYIPALTRSPTICAIVLVCSALFPKGQVLSDQAAHNRQTFVNVVFLRRHGVRSPTKEPSNFIRVQQFRGRSGVSLPVTLERTAFH